MSTALPAISELQQLYRSGQLQPAEVLDRVYRNIASHREHNIWISLADEARRRQYLADLEQRDPHTSPLFGIPFAVKDNIDVAGLPTTAACPEFSYLPQQSAFVVAQLEQAGAFVVGKTNMDQFATGLVGTRSPFGATLNSRQPEFISGGSSSGSAVAVALDQVCFSLGTDTAGSGRVPAAFNQLIGCKPTRGLLSNSGVVPACRTLDCVSIFTRTAADLRAVLPLVCAEDEADAWSRHDPLMRLELLQELQGSGADLSALRIGVPASSELVFFGHGDYSRRFDQLLAVLKAAGVRLHEIDYSPFMQAASLLYAGPWVAERYLAARELIDSNPEALLPELQKILLPASSISATQAFECFYQLQDSKKLADRQLAAVDCILVPTAGGCYTIREVQDEPIQRNSDLGLYTNFMNLLDYAAIAVPGDIAAGKLPFGVTLFGQAGSDAVLLKAAEQLMQLAGWQQGVASPAELAVA